MNTTVERLLDLASRLDEQDLVSLMAFAEFLATRHAVSHPAGRGDRSSKPALAAEGGAASTPAPPGHIVAESPVQATVQRGGGNAAALAQPDSESVVAAIKRLVAEHPDLERRELLRDAVQLMERFITGACSKTETIAQLEALFAARASGTAGSS